MHNIARTHKLLPCAFHGVLCTTTEIKEDIIMSEKEKALTLIILGIVMIIVGVSFLVAWYQVF